MLGEPKGTETTAVADFWMPRACFREPIPELHRAADLLSDAADALLAGDVDHARDCLRLADIPAVWAFASSIMGRTTVDIHRYRRATGAGGRPIVYDRIEDRMPSAAIKGAVHRDDGWRCRFCSCRVVLPAARDRMRRALPGSIGWRSANKDKHAAFFALSATIDHIVPHAYGGTNERNNLVTTCQACNFGRNNWLIEEVGLVDPRTRPPLCDDWDGLSRVLRHKMA